MHAAELWSNIRRSFIIAIRVGNNETVSCPPWVPYWGTCLNREVRLSSQYSVCPLQFFGDIRTFTDKDRRGLWWREVIPRGPRKPCRYHLRSLRARSTETRLPSGSRGAASLLNCTSECRKLTVSAVCWSGSSDGPHKRICRVSSISSASISFLEGTRPSPKRLAQT
jgi:hypothetical protein